MPTQWENLLQNLGEWQGSFTRFSPQGELIEDTPTVVSLEGLNNNQTIRQVVRRLPSNQDATEIVLEYSSLNKSILFHQDGAFSQGTIQLAPYSEFGAELGLIEGKKRLRLVQLFNTSGTLERITLIREHLAGVDATSRPVLSVEQLMGTWEGEAVTIYPDWRSPDTYPTTLKISREGKNKLRQQLSFGDRIMTSQARIEGSILHFEQGSYPIQVLLLPDGASSNCPLHVKSGHPFFLEIGWLLQPDYRQRLIRSYSDKGEWISLTLVKECRVK